MGQPPPCPHGSEPKGHLAGFLIHTQYTGGIQHTAGLATKEAPHTQHERAVPNGRTAGGKNVANWRRGDSRTARSLALLPKAGRDWP